MASTLKRKVDSPHCSVCTEEMQLTMAIPSCGRPHALVYTCPKCGHSESCFIAAYDKAA
jgi:predicted RNA-binding Zn-ribbon protein involved in translation (DUF1610 family)